MLVVVAVVGFFDSFSVFANSDVMFALVQLLSDDINKESPHPLPLPVDSPRADQSPRRRVDHLKPARIQD